jgi:LmbE family N-acetylglucosaminyl deacetylase
MCILAHPDDESLGMGGLLAKSAAEGVETYVVCATAGQLGWPGDRPGYPGPEELGRIRAAELQAATAVLGVKETTLLGYLDGSLDQADPAQVTADLVHQLWRVRPQVVVTFSPDGGYGHPDHIAISQLALSAIVCAADNDYAACTSGAPHRVAKFYYRVESKEFVAAVTELIGVEFGMEVDGVFRAQVSWPAWSITTRIDAGDYWEQVWQAALCHQTQMVGLFEKLAALSPEAHRRLWGAQTFYRVYSLVNGGRQPETDLFAGIR